MLSWDLRMVRSYLGKMEMGAKAHFRQKERFGQRSYLIGKLLK